MTILMELKGKNGQLELYEDKVILRRKGVLAKMTQGFTTGDKTFYIRQITSMDLKLGGTFVNGYIQFTMGGSSDKQKGAFEAVNDENSIMFVKKNNEIAKKVVAKIEELQKELHKPQSSISGADELIKFKQLFDEGVITEEQFEKKKEEILS